MRKGGRILVVWALSLILASLLRGEDPPFEQWGTYLGGSGMEGGYAVDVDADGSVVVGGEVRSPDFLELAGLDPLPFGGQADAVVVRLSPDGREVLAAFSLGGPGEDRVWDLVLTADGRVVVLGDVSPGWVPPEGTCAAEAGLRGGRDVFVAVLDEELELVSLDLLGGSGDDAAMDIDLADDGTVALMANTMSRDLETTPGAFQESYQGGETDYLVARLDPRDELACGERVRYVTYLGSSATEDEVDTHTNGGLVAGPDDLITIAGVTHGGQVYPRTDTFRLSGLGGRDVVATQLRADATLEPSRQLVYSTVLGGSGNEKPKWVGVTLSGAIQVVGWTWSTNYPRSDGTEPHHGQNDIFITQLDPTAAPDDQIVVSELIGGGSYDPPGDCVSRPDGSILIGGITGGVGFPTTPGALPVSAAVDQAYVIEWRPAADSTLAHRLRYSSLITSGGWCEWIYLDRVWDLALAPGGAVVACGTVCGVLATETSTAAQPILAGGSDMFVMSLDLRIPEARLDATALEGPAPIEICLDASGSETPAGTELVEFSWDLGLDAAEVTEVPELCHVFEEPGLYTVGLTVTNDQGFGAVPPQDQEIAVGCPGEDTSPWSGADVGPVVAAGGSGWVDSGARDSLWLCSSGQRFSGEADAFHFVHRSVEAAGVSCLSADAVEIDADLPFASVGVMLRESLEPDALFASVLLRRSGPRILFQYRDTAGRVRTKSGPAVEELPVGLRIQHRRLEDAEGEEVDEYTGFARLGSEEEGWTEIYRVSLPAVASASPLLAGIVATAGRNAEPRCRAMRATVGDVLLSSSPCPATGALEFRRADANADGKHDVSDAVYTLNWLFLGGPEPGCMAACDANGDANVDLSDAVHLLRHLFLGGAAPVSPFPECGPGTLSSDLELGCDVLPAGCGGV